MTISTRHRTSRSHATRRILSTAFVALAALASACASPTQYVVEGETVVYTLTNLHPDEATGRLYSLNYQQDGLIPVCTQVNVDSVSSQELRFTVTQTGRQYQYLFTRHLQDAVDMHMGKYFGPNCPDLTQLSPADQSGIQEGRVYQGMSKQGVLIALGYPPEHRTPNLEADLWSYWRNSHDSFQVFFTDGLVSGIRQ